jgi:D-sedoheptulose 7-phosphate isomerase
VSTVFTNGCFDIIHAGHVDFLRRAKELGSTLIVGLNSDSSIRAIKGPGRPINDQESRRSVLEALRWVDQVIIFDEPTPERLISEIKPDILVKGGDWGEGEIIGSDFVKSYGGKVITLALLEGFSTSAVIERIQKPNFSGSAKVINQAAEDNSGSTITTSLKQHLTSFEDFLNKCEDSIRQSADVIFDCISNGGKILICGNGGSAADAQHLAAEFVGRYELERQPLPAIALSTDTSALTAISNDYGFNDVFVRQVKALGRKGDCLVAISTSGNSPNVLAAVMAARNLGMRTIGLTGGAGKKLASLCDITVMVPSLRTSRIQECHITVAHLWCEYVDDRLKYHPLEKPIN